MENGPHAYVPGSFQNMIKVPGNRPGQRVSDDFINEHYSEIKYFTGKKGTMNLVDTRGYHKGTPVVKGHRLLIQLEWADNPKDVITGELLIQI